MVSEDLAFLTYLAYLAYLAYLDYLAVALWNPITNKGNVY